MKPTDYSYHLTNYLGKYLPGILGLRTNTISSYGVLSEKTYLRVKGFLIPFLCIRLLFFLL